MTEEGVDERELLWLLRSKVRRMIIEAVGDSGRIGAVALRDKLGISTGSLYYNLRQLKHLVTQDDRRNYVLTELGERVYKLLKTRGDISLSDLTGKRSRVVEALSQLFVPYWLVAPLAERVRMGAVVAAISFLMLTALLLNQKMDLIVLHVYRFEAFSIPEFLRYLGITLLTIYLFFGLMTALYDLLARSEETDVRGVFGFLKSAITFSGQWRQALVLISLGLLPMSIYPAAAFVDKVTGAGHFESKFIVPNSVVANVVLVVAQMACFLLFSASLSYVRRLRWHVAALISFSAIYLSIVVQYLILAMRGG
jgi:hypothetical protein